MIASRSLVLPLLASLAGLAWVVLWLWERSPYAVFLDHSMLRALCLSSGPLGVVNIYVAGWLLMITAMMLPTTFPLIEMFRRLTQRRSDQAVLILLLIAGYLAVWLAFGVIAHAAEWLVLAGVDSVGLLRANAWAISAGALIVAGAFQFSELKYRCLDKCRTPLSFVMHYWRQQGGRAGAFRLGVWHGAFCVGCCWALMLVMFGVGAGNVGWMLALGAVMALEKNIAWGRRLSPFVGAVLLASGAAIAVQHLVL